MESGVTSIVKNAFNGASVLTFVTLPEGLTEIGDYAFADTGIETVTILHLCRKADRLGQWLQKRISCKAFLGK
ncbi:MAG: leucine-rich repeat protein [Oscillospiraceae bacterium]|nr:leucine-rich repeat protein [Oscillospiraceae bacterium]